MTSGVGTSVRTEDQARSDPRTAHEALAGPDPEPMQEDQTGSDFGKVHVSLAGPNPKLMDEEFLATAYPKVHENMKLITDERVIEDNPKSHSGSMSSMKNLEDTDNFRDQFLYDKPTEDEQEKSKVIDESDSTIPDPSYQTVTSPPPVIAPVIDFSSLNSSSQVTPLPINTEATSITTTLPEITPFIALQLRMAKLEQDMSEVNKTDHSAKYSVLPGLESIKNQESKKSPKEIIRIKREQGEKEQESTYTIRSTDKVALEEFDLKSALFKHMNKNRTANRNPANYHLYHALMEALIADEESMMMMRMIMKTLLLDQTRVRRQRGEEPKSHSLPSNHPPPRKPLKVKLHPKVLKPVTQEPIEEPITEVGMDDLETTANEDVVSDVDHPQYYVAPKTNKLSRDTWFKQPPRPPTPDPEWNKRQVVTVQPEQPWQIGGTL
ncbi:hypothetical protein Tco_0469451 [Tanacetum coccineum]